MDKTKLFEKSYQAIVRERDLVHKVWEEGEAHRKKELEEASLTAHDLFTEICEAKLIDEYLDWFLERTQADTFIDCLRRMTL